MPQPNYAVLDPTAIGANLEIQESGLVVSCSQPAISGASRMKVRANMARSSGVWMFEVAYYGVDDFTSKVLAGICSAPSPLNSAVGGDSSSIGYSIADGGLYVNSALDTACQATGAQTYVQFVVDFTVLKLYVYSSGGLIATRTIAANTYWPAFTVGSVTAYGISMYVNFGQRAFAYPVSNARGWYSIPAPPPALYLGSTGDDAYVSADVDTPARQMYDPAITNLDSFTVERNCSVWVWQDQNSSATYSNIEVDNSSGDYTSMLTADYRDAIVTVKQIAQDQILTGNAYTVATAIIDKVEAIEESVIRISLKDKLASDDRPLQRRIFPPFADKGVAGRPVPIIIGAARSVDVGGFLVDQAARKFQLSDSQITNIGVLRDMGNPLDPAASPPQYTPTSDLQGVVLNVLPQGKCTADVSSQGSQNTYPGVPDVLNGIGTNWDTAWTAATPPPPGWTLTNTDTAGVSVSGKYATSQGYPHNMISLRTTRQVSAIGSGKEYSFKPTSAVLRAGKSYKISFNMYDFQTGGSAPGGGLCVMSAQTNPAINQDWISPPRVPMAGAFHGDLPFTLVYTVPAGADRSLYFTVVGTPAGFPTQTCTCVIYNIVVEELAEAITDVPLIGTTMTNYMTNVLTNHGGLALTEWSQADCAAFDGAYPGAPFGVQISDTATLADATRLLLDSVCATVHTDRLGVRRFHRLNNPRNYTPVATFDENDIDYPVAVSPDTAVGLTQSIGCQRNWSIYSDSDFVTDYNLVPGELRTQLKRASRVIQVCNTQLAGCFDFAKLAGPLDSVFDSEPHARAEIERVNKLYEYVPGLTGGGFNVQTAGTTNPHPNFYTFTINFDGNPPELLFGTTIAVSYTSSVFRLAQNLLVINTKLMLRAKKMQIVGWG